MTVFKTLHVAPSLPCGHIHLLSSDQERETSVIVEISQLSLCVPFLRKSLHFSVRVFPFFSYFLCYSYFGTFLSTWSFHQVLSTPAMSTDVSQVGVTLFPSSKYFLSFHRSRFSFYINIICLTTSSLFISQRYPPFISISPVSIQLYLYFFHIKYSPCTQRGQ